MSKPLVILLLLSVVTFTGGQTPGTCKADEEWQQRDGKFGCFCKDPYKVTALSQMVPDLSCGLSEMIATFHKCQFNDLNIYFNQSHIRDYVYYNFLDDPVTNTFKIQASLDLIQSGGLSYKKNDTHATYTANFIIEVDQPGALITRNNTLTITLQCAYEMDMIASLQKTLHPFIRAINITVPGIGQFMTYMALYKDSSYKTPHTGSQVTLTTEEFLYVGVFTLGGTSNLFLVMNNCYATPTDNVTDTLKYYIIKDSCLNKQDGTINVAENGVSSKGRFSVQMFKFVGPHDQVYLHCQVKLCDSHAGSCIPVCARSASRTDETGTPQGFSTLTIGPIVGSGPSSSITSAHIFWTLISSALIILKQSL